MKKLFIIYFLFLCQLFLYCTNSNDLNLFSISQLGKLQNDVNYIDSTRENQVILERLFSEIGNVYSELYYLNEFIKIFNEMDKEIKPGSKPSKSQKMLYNFLTFNSMIISHDSSIKHIEENYSINSGIRILARKFKLQYNLAKQVQYENKNILQSLYTKYK